MTGATDGLGAEVLVSDAELKRKANFAINIRKRGYGWNSEDSMAVELRDARVTIADLTRQLAEIAEERDCLVEQVASLQDGTLRTEMQLVMKMHNEALEQARAETAAAKRADTLARDLCADFRKLLMAVRFYLEGQCETCGCWITEDESAQHGVDVWVCPRVVGQGNACSQTRWWRDVKASPEMIAFHLNASLPPSNAAEPEAEERTR